MPWATKYPDPPPTTTSSHSSQEHYGIGILLPETTVQAPNLNAFKRRLSNPN